MIILSILIAVTGFILIAYSLNIYIGIAVVCLSITSLLFSFLSLIKIHRYKFDNYIIPYSQDNRINFVSDRISTFKGNTFTDIIRNNIAKIIEGEYFEGQTFSKKIFNEYLQLDFENDSKHVYKLNYSSRNINHYKMVNKIQKLCHANYVAKSICEKYNLDSLYIPQIYLNNIYLDDDLPNLTYDLAIEEQIPFIVDEKSQKRIYNQHSDSIKHIIQQLTIFICLTGW